MSKPPQFYIIYEIPGRKIGCTKNLKMRLRLYEIEDGSKPVVQIRELIPSGMGDQYAGDREWYWADLIGYPKGTHYAVQNGFKTGAAGRKAVERKAGVHGLSREQLSRNGRKSVELGVGIHGRSPEKMSSDGREAGKISGKKAAELGLGFCGMTREQRSVNGQAGGKIGGRMGGFAQQTTCPYCGKVGQTAAMHYRHFDNCPHNPRS